MGPDIGTVVAAGVEGVSDRHVLRPNMADSPESGDGLEVRAEERIQFLKGIVRIGEHLGNNVAPLEDVADEWLGRFAIKVRGTIICILYPSLHQVKFVWTHKIRFWGPC